MKKFNLDKTIFIVWLLCFISALTYATWKDVIMPIALKEFWKLADKASKGILHSVDQQLDTHINAFGNYDAKCYQLMQKHYSFTPEGFQDYINDRDNILSTQNVFIDMVGGVAKGYKESMIDEHGFGDK